MASEANEIEKKKRLKTTKKVRLLTLADLDGRTRAAQHALELRASILSDLGGQEHTSIAQRELAQRAAILGAALEDIETRWLKGNPIELKEYATLINAQRRVLSDLGLERGPRDVTPSLAQYLESQAE